MPLIALLLGVAAVVSCSYYAGQDWVGNSATYDPVTDTWHEANRAVEHHDYGSALVEHLGTLYQFTGRHTYACDLATDTWTVRCDAPAEQHFGTAFEIHDRIYVFLGEDDSTGVPRWVGEYNPVLDEWALLSNVPQPRAGSFAACVNDRIYLMGGDIPGNPMTRSGDVWEYEPITDSWTLHGSTYGRSYAVCAGLGSNIYIFGGWTDSPSEPGNKVLCYTPGSDTSLWCNDIDASFPFLTVYHPDRAVVLNDLVYLVTEWNGMFVYDYMTDSWSAESAPGFYVRGLAAAGDRLYAFGGLWKPK